MTNEDDASVGSYVERCFNRADHVIDVNEGVRGGRSTDERQDAAIGHLEQGQHRRVLRTIDNTWTKNRPAQAGAAGDQAFAGKFADAVRGDRRDRIAFLSRRGGWSRTSGSKARDVHEADTG